MEVQHHPGGDLHRDHLLLHGGQEKQDLLRGYRGCEKRPRPFLRRFIEQPLRGDPHRRGEDQQCQQRHHHDPSYTEGHVEDSGHGLREDRGHREARRKILRREILPDGEQHRRHKNESQPPIGRKEIRESAFRYSAGAGQAVLLLEGEKEAAAETAASRKDHRYKGDEIRHAREEGGHRHGGPHREGRKSDLDHETAVRQRRPQSG